MELAGHSASLLFTFFLFPYGGAAATPQAKDVQAASIRPQLPAEAARRVEELEAELERLRSAHNFLEMIPLAAEVAEIRERHQGGAWWETVDADHRITRLRKVASFAADQQSELVALEVKQGKIEPLYNQSKLGEALQLAEVCRDGFARLFGVDSRDALASRMTVAQLQRGMGQYETAEATSHTVLPRLRAILGEEHPKVSECLTDIGVTLYFQGAYDEAERYYNAALAIRRRTLGNDHVAVAQMLNNLAASYVARGEYKTAEPLYLEALRIWRAEYGTQHAEIGTVLNNLGNLARYQGQLRRAEVFYRESLRMRRTVLPPGHIEIGTAAHNLASVLMARGDLVSAEPLFHEVLEVWRESLGEQHLYVGHCMNSLASLYKDMRRYKQAEALYRESMRIRRSVLGDEHPTVAESLNHLARLLALTGRHEESERLYRKALAVWRENFGQTHPRLADGLSNLGYLLMDVGRAEEAEEHFREAIEIRKERLGPRHFKVAGGLFNLSVLLIRQQRYEEAETYLREALGIAQERRSGIAAGASGRATFAAIIRLPQIAGALADLLLRSDHPGEAFEVLERGRARAVLDLLAQSDRDLIAEARATLGDAGSAVLEEALAVESAARKRLHEAEAALGRQHGEDDAGNKDDQTVSAARQAVEAARKALRAAEAEVLSRLAVVWPDAQPASLGEIQGRLEPGELIFTVNWTPTSVSVLLVPPASKPVEGRFVADGAEEVEALGTLVEKVRRRLQTRPGPAKQADGVLAELRERLMPNALRDRVFSARRLVVVADGPLRTIPIEPLILAPDRGSAPKRTERQRADASPAVVYTDSATVYINRRRARRDRQGEGAQWSALLLADPRFGPAGDGSDDTSGGDARDESPLLALRSAEQQSAEVSALDQIRLYGGALTPLPGTRREARAIARIIEQAGGEPVVLEGGAASLTALEQNASEARFLHLATHGLAGSSARPFDASLALAQPAEPSPEDIGFLTLDRLFRAWRGKLRDCELAVLSACDTQLGVTRGDSVMALPWGFMYAGAPAVLASLWKVDDEATRLLMQRFYENLLGQYSESRSGRSAGTAMPADEALREAKLWLRRLSPGQTTFAMARGGLGTTPVRVSGTRNVRTYDDPFYWAGFVLIGAPD